MRGFPPELILILVFGVLLLLKILKQEAARQRRAALPPPPEDVETPEAEWNSAPFEAEPPPPLVQALAHRHHDAAPAAPVQPRSRLRVARQALFGARWDMQEAIVVATILGRCRADEPHDIR